MQILSGHEILPIDVHNDAVIEYQSLHARNEECKTQEGVLLATIHALVDEEQRRRREFVCADMAKTLFPDYFDKLEKNVRDRAAISNELWGIWFRFRMNLQLRRDFTAIDTGVVFVRQGPGEPMIADFSRQERGRLLTVF